jgi:cobalt-zinc-cadmium efflux system membrane fusion protein
LLSCNGGKDADNAEENGVISQAFLENVQTEKPALSNQEQELILSGKVECDPNKVVYYTPLISGLIERTCFSLGDKVQKGQTMLTIRSSALSALQSELAVARRNLQSAEAMYEDNLISEKELIEARAAYEKLQADLALYGENQGGGVFAVKSSMTGFVVEKNASAGSTISESDKPLFTIADLSSVWVIANVYAGNLQYIKEGTPVEISALAYPDEVFEGTIDALSQVFDLEEKVLKARIMMPNHELKFKPEMSVVVKLKNETHQQCLSIPSDALIFDDNRYFVVVETAPSTFAIKEIQRQGHYRKTSYIRSGLDENDRVVVKNQLLIYSELKGK